jgi:hypothetical protein
MGLALAQRQLYRGPALPVRIIEAYYQLLAVALSRKVEVII